MFGFIAISEFPHSSSSEMLNRNNGEVISLVLNLQNSINVTLSIQK